MDMNGKAGIDGRSISADQWTPVDIRGKFMANSGAPVDIHAHLWASVDYRGQPWAAVGTHP